MICLFSVHNFDEGCGDDEGVLGEVQGFMNAQGEVVGFWSLNDANWRNEYFNATFQALGIEIQPASEEQNRAFVAHLFEIGYA